MDGPLEKLRCPGCRSVIEVPREYWIDILGASCRKMQDMEKGRATGSILMGTFMGDRSLARFDPYCDRCKTDIEDPWRLEPGTIHRCANCGTHIPVESPPRWLQDGVPGASLLVNALLELSETESLPPSIPGPFSCPSCAAILEITGDSRLVDCGYCGSRVYLPDNVWHRLHPPDRHRRWFVMCRNEDEASADR